MWMVRMVDGGPRTPLVAWRRLMGFFTDILRSRVLPAVVAALGVSFIAAGLLTYTTGADAELFPFPSDGIAVSQPGDPSNPAASDDSGPGAGASDAASP